MMNKIPLQVKLKREVHRKIAYAQDIIIEEVYKFFMNAVLHGGTAIWRVYSGKRFSEDLDFYLEKNKEKIDLLFGALEKKGFAILKKKVSENSIYSELVLDRTPVRFEATFQNIKGSLCDYELSDGNILAIYSLTVEEFIKEKTNAYLKRLKIRDLWDIFFLLKDVSNFHEVKDALGKLLKGYKKPIDEKDLQAIILEGIVPSSDEMIEYIKRKWEKENT